MIDIQTITVRRLKTGPGYNNVAHEATASVPTGCSPEDLERIRDHIDLQVQAWNDKKSVDEMRTEQQDLSWSVPRLRQEKVNLEAEVESLKRRLSTMKSTPLEQLIAEDDGRPF